MLRILALLAILPATSVALTPRAVAVDDTVRLRVCVERFENFRLRKVVLLDQRVAAAEVLAQTLRLEHLGDGRDAVVPRLHLGPRAFDGAPFDYGLPPEGGLAARCATAYLANAFVAEWVEVEFGTADDTRTTRREVIVDRVPPALRRGADFGPGDLQALPCDAHGPLAARTEVRFLCLRVGR